MAPEELLSLFTEVAAAVRRAVLGIDHSHLRSRTSKPGQYALDLVADRAALRVLGDAGLRVLSEESGVSGPDGELTVVLDPVDGSTNCAHRISYWSTSICALDGHGPVVALVVNQATEVRYSAIRGKGARRDGEPIRPSGKTLLENSVVGLSGIPARILPWRQTRTLGCASLSLCDVAAGGLDGYVDGGSWHAPWDYLGGYLMCVEAGAPVRDAAGDPLVTTAASARRQLVAAATPELLAALLPAAGGRV